jgi:molybdopterin-guanine dinucleotide biosynthesis protein A
VTGAVLVGGASARFGSPKALAQFRGEMLAVRAHRLLEQAFGRVIVVGKTVDALRLPFPVLDDGSGERAAIVGVAGALRHAETDVCLVLPTDMPFVTVDLMWALAAGAEGVDAAVVETGPLPGAYRRAALPVLDRRIAAGELTLRHALGELKIRVVAADEAELRNVNTPADLVS